MFLSMTEQVMSYGQNVLGSWTKMKIFEYIELHQVSVFFSIDITNSNTSNILYIYFL